MTWARSVSAELVRFGALCSTTCASLIASAAEVCSWAGNWIPVLLSGGIWVQSTLSRVNIVFGSLGYSRKARALAPRRRSPVTSNAYCVYAPWMALWPATSCPLSHRSASPTTPLTTSVAWRETDPPTALKVVRNHHGTANRPIVSRPSALM